MQETSNPEFYNDNDEQVVERAEKKSWLASEARTQLIYGAFGLAMIAIVMSWLQSSTKAICCGDFDGYYHIRWSQLLWDNFRQGKWLPDFIWLPLTVLSPSSYADHHFLFHLLQIPFLWLFEPVTAAKLGAVVFATLAIFSCYWLILYYKVDYPIIWLLALLTCANPFYYRMNMAKAPPIAIILTILGIWLHFERRYIWLLPLTFVFVWAYSLYPMLIVASIIWAAIIYWNESEIEWRPFAYTVGGAIAGNIINPYFPRNLWLFWEHFWTKFRTNFDVPVGGEWYPYDSKMLLGLCIVALIAMFIGYILYQPSEKRLDEKSTFFLLFATFLMIWTFQSKRFAEYFPPLAILFAAFTFQAFNRSKPDALLLPEDFRRDLSPFLDREVATANDDKRDFWQTACVYLISGMLFVYMILMMNGIEIPRSLLSEAAANNRCLKEDPFTAQNRCIIQKGLRHELEQNDPLERFQKGAEWAAKNVPAIDENGRPVRIFNTDWDDFPKLFFHDTKHAYIAGLDPNYLFSRNPENWKLYEQITTGKMDDPAPTIRDKFGARYIFSDLHHDDFYAKIMESGWVEKIYEDDDSMILRIRDEKGDPPSETDAAENASDDDSGADDNSNAIDEDAAEDNVAPENDLAN